MIYGLLLYAVVKIFPALSMIVYMVTMYLIFSSDDYVAYSAAIAAGVIGAQLASSWLSSAIIFYFPLRKEKASFIIQVMRIGGGSVIVTSLLSFGVFLFIFKEFSLATCVFFLTLSQGLFYITVAFFQPERKMYGQVLSAITLCITQLFFAAYAILFNKHSLELSVLGYGAGFLVAFITLVICVRWNWFIGGFRKRQRRLAVKEMPLENSKIFSYGGPMFVWFSLMLVSGYTDRLFLGKVEGLGVAGYAFTKDILIGVSGFISMPIMLIAHSMIFRLYRERKYKELSELMYFSTTLLIVLFIFAVFIYGAFVKVQLAYFSPDLNHVSFIRVIAIGSGVLLGNLALYAQKKFEVIGHLKQLVTMAFLSNTFAFFAYMYSFENESLDLFALAYALSALLYFLMTVWIGSQKMRFSTNYSMIAIVLVVMSIMYVFSPSAIYVGRVDWSAAVWSFVWLGLIFLILIVFLLRIFRSFDLRQLR